MDMEDMDMEDMDMEDMDMEDMPSEDEVKEAVESVLRSMSSDKLQALEEAVLGPKTRTTTAPSRHSRKTSKVPTAATSASKPSQEVSQLKSKLRESYKTVANLQDTLNEVSLINTKLLYTGKLFRTYNNLSEKNKVAILEFFDKVNTLEDVKVLYGKFNKALGKQSGRLSESTSNRSNVSNTKPNKPTNLHESTASRFAGSNTKGTKILQEDLMVARFQELAGIIKK
jgi:hypothetical protein